MQTKQTKRTKSASLPRRIKPGTALDKDVTVLGVVNAQHTKTVYLVWHRRAWCPMACKVYESVEKAQREAAVLRKFTHPNIVRCLGVGRVPYMLMEFLEGPTLDDFIGSKPGGRLAVSDAMRVAIHLGSALIHMHDRGYLHLDVKPSNAIIYRGRPVLFDLDVARRRSAALMGTGSGTRPYMSPEQCTQGELTQACDVFGLGATLFRVLTGENPFPTWRGRNRYAQTKVDSTPLRRHLPRAPKALEALLQRCLARSAADRPALIELLPALHEFITEGPKMWPEGFTPVTAAREPAGKKVQPR